MKATAVARAAFATSIGRKLVMALTGLFLTSFLIVHLSGNLLLLKTDGGEAFNAYAHFMETNPIIRILEIGLLAGFLFHIAYGLNLAMSNAKARPQGYRMVKASQTSTFYSRFMTYSGLAVLGFLFLHLWGFWYKMRFKLTDLSPYDLAVEKFTNPVFSIIYVIAMALIAFHLAHGFQSAFQTIGLQVSVRLEKKFRTAGLWFAILICTAFAIIPLFFLFRSIL